MAPWRPSRSGGARTIPPIQKGQVAPECRGNNASRDDDGLAANRRPGLALDTRLGENDTALQLGAAAHLQLAPFAEQRTGRGGSRRGLGYSREVLAQRVLDRSFRYIR